MYLKTYKNKYKMLSIWSKFCLNQEATTHGKSITTRPSFQRWRMSTKKYLKRHTTNYRRVLQSILLRGTKQEQKQQTVCRAVNPPRLQILRIDRERTIDGLILLGIWRHLFKKYSLTRLSRICDVSHYCVSLGTFQWHNIPYQSLWGNVRC